MVTHFPPARPWKTLPALFLIHPLSVAQPEDSPLPLARSFPSHPRTFSLTYFLLMSLPHAVVFHQIPSFPASFWPYPVCMSFGAQKNFPPELTPWWSSHCQVPFFLPIFALGSLGFFQKLYWCVFIWRGSLPVIAFCTADQSPRSL